MLHSFLELIADATVNMTAMSVEAKEMTGGSSVDVCVTSGITGDIECDLVVSLQSNDVKASELFE